MFGVIRPYLFEENNHAITMDSQHFGYITTKDEAKGEKCMVSA
jgi:hypothetical protein